MADVLRGMEDAEGQPSQEVTRGQEAGHGAEPEARARCSGEEEEEEEQVRRCDISPVQGGDVSGLLHCRKRDTSSSCGMLSDL